MHQPERHSTGFAPPTDGDKEARIQYYRQQRELRLQKKRKLQRKKKQLILLAGLVLLCIMICFACSKISSFALSSLAQPGQTVAQEQFEIPETIQVGTVTMPNHKIFSATDKTVAPDENQVASAHAILIDASTNEILVEKNAYATISPASMTKILTLLVAVEQIDNLDDTVTITREITDFSYSNKCSAVGYLDNDVATLRDLLYGCILPSGADASLGLAYYVAGSQEAFVELMNQKLAELGLSDTAHFTNCVGIYNELHYCTAYDMAVILRAALENDICRQVLSTKVYTTGPTIEHPEGITISNWFLRRIEDKQVGDNVLCGKTGFVNQSGNCAASYAISESGKPYIAVTANTFSNWRCINDHVALYQLYAP